MVAHERMNQALHMQLAQGVLLASNPLLMNA